MLGLLPVYTHVVLAIVDGLKVVANGLKTTEVSLLDRENVTFWSEADVLAAITVFIDTGFGNCAVVTVTSGKRVSGSRVPPSVLT